MANMPNSALFALRCTVLAAVLNFAAAHIVDPLVARTAVNTASKTSIPAKITAPPSSRALELRQASDSLCGYGIINNTPEPINCPYGVPCVREFVDTNYVAWCSEPGSLPTTRVYDYNAASPGTCSDAGIACCPAQAPFYDKFEFDNAQTILLFCNTYANNPTFTATTSLPSSYTSANPSTTTVTRSGNSVPVPNRHSTKEHQSQHVHTSPSSSGKSTGIAGLSTGAWIGIGVSAFFGILGAVLAVVFGVSQLFRHKFLEWWSKWCCCGDCTERLGERPNESWNLSTSNVHYHLTENPARMEYSPPVYTERW